jgi:integrase
VNIHILRHTCASRLLERGVDLYTVSKWLGHSSVKVTERYAHLARNALEGACAALAGTLGRDLPTAESLSHTLGTPPSDKLLNGKDIVGAKGGTRTGVPPDGSMS